MYDEEKEPQNEDEFSFSDAEEPNVYSDTQSSSSKFSKLSRKNILISIGVIVIALLAYNFVGSFLQSNVNKVPTVKETTAQQPTTSQTHVPYNVTTPQEQSTTKNTTINGKSSSPLNNIVNQRLGEMQEHDVQSKQRIEVIANSLSELSDTTSNIQDSLDSISHQLQTISSQIKQQQASIASLKHKKKVREVNVSRKRKAAYYVQAIIPGRAWLVKPDGVTVTVNIGDDLPGYGKVKHISASEGTVEMNTGAILRYKMG